MLVIAKILVILSILPVTWLVIVRIAWKMNKDIGNPDRPLYLPYWVERFLKLFAPVLSSDVKHPQNIGIFIAVLILMTGGVLPAMLAGLPWLFVGLGIDLVCYLGIWWVASLMDL